MIAALKKLSVDNLSNLLPHPLYVFLSYSHPADTGSHRRHRRHGRRSIIDIDKDRFKDR